MDCARRGKGSRKSAIRKRMYAHSIAPIIPALLGCGDEPPRVSPEFLAREAADFICCGPMEIFMVMYGGGAVIEHNMPFDHG